MTMLCMAAALTVLSSGQAAAAAFTGSWTAKFEGRTFIKLEIQAVNGTFAGGISLGNFQVDAQGMVKGADASRDRLIPIFGVTQKGSTLTFFIKEGNDTDQFEMRLATTDAELHFLLNEADRQALADSGGTAPKPIRLTRGR